MSIYDEYLAIDYEKLSESEMIMFMLEVFDIDPTTKNGLFNQKKHYAIIESITIASLKLRYELVKNVLREIYPLSFPEIENTFSLKPSEIISCGIEDLEAPTMVHLQTKAEKKSLDGMNALARSFRNKKDK